MTIINYPKNTEPTLTQDPDLHLVTDTGLTLTPHIFKNNTYTFLLPEEVKNIYIRSRTSSPRNHVGSPTKSQSQLGVLIGQIHIITHNQLYPVTEHLSQYNLDGWDKIEQTNSRWTNGNAELNVNVQVNNNSRRLLTIQVLSTNYYLLNNPLDQIPLSNIA